MPKMSKMAKTLRMLRRKRLYFVRLLHHHHHHLAGSVFKGVRASADCNLSSLPLEIRSAIYAHLLPTALHISLHPSGDYYISRCVTSAIYCELDWGISRATSQSPYDDQVWARRLGSAWGPHWACEEASTTVKGDFSLISMLLTCKWMYNDTVNALGGIVDFHMADVGFLSRLLKPETPHQPYNMAANILQVIHKLHFNARLSLSACKMMEGESDAEPASNETVAAVELWNVIWPAMAQLTELRMLRIEIDHTALEPWSIVHERAIASPLATLAAIAPQITVVIAFPILHPFFEDPSRHFLEANDTPRTRLTIHRRLRQAFHPTGKTGILDRIVRRSCRDNYPMPLHLRKLLHCESTPQELRQEEEDLVSWRDGQDLHVEELFTDDTCEGCGAKKPRYTVS